MKAPISLAVLSAALAPIPLFGQPVPEGIHSEGKGSADVCGVSAPSVEQLEAIIKARSGTEVLQGTPEYNAYALPEMKVLTFTTPANRAHPAVACRRITTNAAGGSDVRLEISCFNTRANCDWLYREFDALNERMKRELRSAQ